VFTLLLAVLPAGVCVCELLNLEHTGQAAESGESEDCPCHCKLHPRETTTPTPPAVEGDTGLSLVLTAADLTHVPSAALASPFRSESPPHDPSRPRYLVVGRLLI